FAEKEAPYVSLGIYDLHSKSLATRYGVVKIDKRNKVLDFQEKPKNPASSLVAMCMYYFPKETLGYLKEYIKDLKKNTDRAGDYIRWLMTKGNVFGFKFSGVWWDIGQLDTYHQAQKYFSKTK
ncbi:MAG: sugar phosphate nucleotidyltransferase, partial [Candidatus Omnitrophica bacterium]|nr:sugar phosphate nucleotidyltransferase [Candidatus Omnitrophota bacterium]